MEVRLEERYSSLAWMVYMNAVRAVNWTVASITGSGKAMHDSMQSCALVQNPNPNSTDAQVRISYLVPTAYLPPTAQDHTAFTAFMYTTPAKIVGGYSN